MQVESMQLSAEPTPASSTASRWAVLAVVSLAMFGSSYIYDSIGPLAKVLADQLRYTDEEISLLQVCAGLPSLGMALLGGIVVDRIGVKKAGLIFALLCLSGAILAAVSPRLPVMLAGRFLFGLGIGSLSIASTTGISQWFAGERLSFVLGLNLTVSRLGSLTAQISPIWAAGAYATWRGPLLLNIASGLLCVLAMGAYWALENRTRDRQTASSRSDLKPSFKGARSAYSRSYWLAVLLCLTFYAGIFPFQTFAQKFFMEAHGITREGASLRVGAITVIAIVATPFWGFLVDRIGQRVQLMVVGSALLTPVYLMMAHPGFNLWIPVALMGIAYSLVPAILWPSVVLIVPHARLGQALGLMSLIQGMGLVGFNYLVGWANDHGTASAQNPSGYQAGMWLFTVTAVLGFLCACLLRASERGPDGQGLDFPEGRKERAHD